MKDLTDHLNRIVVLANQAQLHAANGELDFAGKDLFGIKIDVEQALLHLKDMVEAKG